MCVNFYRYQTPPFRLSKFLVMSKDIRESIIKDLSKDSKKLVDVFSYCFMPTHFHFLLKQTEDNGISKFISQFENSYTRYFDTRNERQGGIFLNQFKAKRIELGEVLLHVQRYIHLNPYSSCLVKDIDQLINYEYSSLSEYLDDRITGLCNQESVMSLFKNKKMFRSFTLDQAEYQRNLEYIKHLTFE